MITENDPPLTESNVEEEAFDDIEHFDDTFSEDGVPDNKPSSPIVKLGGLVVILTLLGAGYYYTTMEDFSATSQPVAPVIIGEKVSVHEGADIDHGMPPQPDAFGADMGDMPMDGDVNDVFAADMDVMDPFSENSEEAFDPEIDLKHVDDATIEGGTVLAEDQNIEIVEIENFNLDAMTDDEGLDERIDEEPIVLDNTEVEDQAEIIGFVEPITPAETLDEVATENALDEELQKQLLESLMSSPAPAESTTVVTTTTVETITPDPTRSPYQGQTLGVAPNQTSRDNALREIETPAMMRPQPKEFYVLRRESGSEDRNSKLVSARRALRTGRNAQALMEFDGLISDGHTNEAIYLGRAVALQRLGQFEEALSVYEDVLQQNPENLDALTNVLGILAMQSPGYSVDKLERLQAKYPVNVGIMVQLALSKADAGNLREAVGLLSSAHKMDPLNASIVYNLAIMYDRYGDRVSAASYYRRSLVLARENKTLSSIPVSSINTRLSTIR